MQFDNNNLDSNAINGFLNLFVNITPAITNKYINSFVSTNYQLRQLAQGLQIITP